jgi:hypothetical protein
MRAPSFGLDRGLLVYLLMDTQAETHERATIEALGTWSVRVPEA